MKNEKKLSENIYVQLVFLSITVFISRLPFLFAGYGAEEDSWLLVITARNIAESGVYEMSRAPAHPLQEIIYSLIWNAGPFVYNLLSAVMSVIAVVFFALSLLQLGFKHYLFASFALAFTPVVFISSTYTIDYMWAMAFVMLSFYFVTSPLPLSKWRGDKRIDEVCQGEAENGIKRMLLAGIFLGFAIGCRITSVAMLVPFALLLFRLKNSVRNFFSLFITTVLVGFIIYIPVFKTYGISFITTYFDMADRFPAPPFTKIFYKATIGVFGLTGMLALVFFMIISFVEKKSNALCAEQERKIPIICALVIIIYLLFYIRVPHKSAFLIPIVPFVILLFGYLLSSSSFKIFCVLLTLSSFLFSMNLTDSLRGAKYSPLAVKFTVSGQEIFLDPLTGPVFSDYTKRLNKILFTKTVLKKTETERSKIVLICGWWYNQLRVEQWSREKNPNVEFVFYIDKETMKRYISEGYEIYYLPKQNIYNDLYSKMNFTDSVAKPYF